jgi:hypothetical protein
MCLVATREGHSQASGQGTEVLAFNIPISTINSKHLVYWIEIIALEFG